MSREIKFRVYDKQEKCYSDKAFSADRLGICCVQDEDGHWEEMDKNRFVIEQYAGIEDIDSKEVYEGDIINGHTFAANDTKLRVYEVFWSEVDLCFAVRNGHDVRPLTCMFPAFFIVGNIHENPELLDSCHQKSKTEGEK